MPNIHFEYLLVDRCDETLIQRKHFPAYCDYVPPDCCGLVLSNVVFYNLWFESVSGGVQGILTKAAKEDYSLRQIHETKIHLTFLNNQR